MEHQELINQTQQILADPGIPDWAKIMGALISLAVIGLSAYYGRKRSGDPVIADAGKSVVLEGALVDSASIKVLAGSVEALGMTIKTAEVALLKNLDLLEELVSQVKKSSSNQGDMIKALEDVSEQLDRQAKGRDDLTYEMRELRMTINLSNMRGSGNSNR